MSEMNQEGKSRPLRSTTVVIVLAAVVATVTVFVVLQIEWAFSTAWSPAQTSGTSARQLTTPQAGPDGPSVPAAPPGPQREQTRSVAER
ncbi:MAG: hypothetical protein HYU77_05650 [Betaproteobacteria bacterium]|nr:hypothetical protein [Betaproteobacteria bacterium]